MPVASLFHSQSNLFLLSAILLLLYSVSKSAYHRNLQDFMLSILLYYIRI